MTNAIDSSALRDYSTIGTVQTPTVRQAGARDVDPNTVTSARLDYGQLSTNLRSSVIAQTSSIVSPGIAAQSQLDAYRASYTATYNVGGSTVRVAPQFRMVGGFNDASAGYVRGRFDVNNNTQVKELFAICARAQIGGAMHCLMGCPTANELRQVTQALIDAGKLPSGTGSVESRIKTMQWQRGIGIDCTDYVLDAALRASGRSSSSANFRSLPSPGTDYFQQADANPHLRKTSVSNARPGDVVVLDSPGDVGHRAVVYSNTICDPAKLSACVAIWCGGDAIRKRRPGSRDRGRCVVERGQKRR